LGASLPGDAGGTLVLLAAGATLTGGIATVSGATDTDMVGTCEGMGAGTCE
jgi:hypothetical protein